MPRRAAVVNNRAQPRKGVNHELRHYKWLESSCALPEAAPTSRRYGGGGFKSYRVSLRSGGLSQINRRECWERQGARGIKGETSEDDEKKRETTEKQEQTRPAGDEDAFHSADENERKETGDEAGGRVSKLFSARPRYRRRIFLDDALSCFE